MSWEGVKITGFVCVLVGLLLRLLFSRWVPRGQSKRDVRESDLRASIASRWLSPRVCQAGALASVAFLVTGAALLFWSFVQPAGG